MGIQIENVSKRYGSKVALESITIQFTKGCNCILGNNGAGKSTLLNIIMNLIEPDSGHILINNRSYKIKEESLLIKQQIGGFTDIDKLIDDLSISQFLFFVSSLYNIDQNIAAERISSLLRFLFFENSVEGAIIRTLSTGMKKKVEIISSLIHNPEVVILDEPFAGLDPTSSIDLIKLIQILKNKIIVISSHDLEYVDQCADFIHVINENKLDFSGTLNQFKISGKSIFENFIDHTQRKENKLTDLNWLLENE